MAKRLFMRQRVDYNHRRTKIAAVGHSRTLATIQSRASPLIPNPIKKMAIQLKRQRGARARPATWVRSKVFINEKVPGARSRIAGSTRLDLNRAHVKTLRLLRLRMPTLIRFTTLISILLT